MVSHSKDHHRDEAKETHVHVCRAVNDPQGMRGHCDTEGDTQAEPGQRRLDETSYEPVHVSGFRLRLSDASSFVYWWRVRVDRDKFQSAGKLVLHLSLIHISEPTRL